MDAPTAGTGTGIVKVNGVDGVERPPSGALDDDGAGLGDGLAAAAAAREMAAGE